jgi:hypothetical protein
MTVPNNTNSDNKTHPEANESSHPIYELSKELLKTGLFAFINVDDKKLMVVHGLNMLEGFTRHMAQFSHGLHKITDLQKDYDENKLRLRILETIPRGTSNYYTSSKLLLRKAYWVKLYLDNGYTLYPGISPGMNFNVRFHVKDSLIHVLLVNQQNRSFCVGIFDRVADAHAFKDKYYSGDILEVVYADNQLSKSIQRVLL